MSYFRQIKLERLKLARLLLSAALATSCFSAQSQEDPTNKRASSSVNWESIDAESGVVFTPTISLGVGMLGFYGDISRDNRANNPLTSRLAYNLQLVQPINDFLNLSFQIWTGKVSANERSITRNLNFESTLTGGGIGLEYNFDHLLPEDRILEPYVGVGIHTFEFISKTDLQDEFGNTYFYWEDGTVRNLPEDAPNFTDAVRIQRDYVYETDIRTLNADGFDEYDEFSFAIPVSAGVRMNLSERVKFKVGATYFFSQTDFIDGITANSAGNRSGDDRNDRFLYTSFSFSYDLTRPKRAKKGDAYDFTEIENADNDSDMVIDFLDLCAATPKGVEVDEFGCPLDNDKDAVGNYKDEEPGSKLNAFVDTVGITYTDERLIELRTMFLDSTGLYSKIERESYAVDIAANRTKRKSRSATTYAVKIGEFEKSIPPNLVNSILSLPDVTTSKVGNKIVVSVGSYESLPEALQRKIELEKQGVAETGLVSKNTAGQLKNVDGKIATYDENKWPFEEKIMYRVQLGAFSKDANERIFAVAPNVLAISSTDGFTRYYTGAYDDYAEAARVKIDMLEKGFKDAYVVALRGGSKIPLKEARTSYIPPTERKLSSVEREQLSFKVQLGSYRASVPTKTLEKYMELNNVEEKKGDDGVTRYVAGDFRSYEEANQFKQTLIGRGFEGVFVVGEFDGELLPAKDAIKMIR